MRTLNLRTKISLLSALSMSVILVVLYTLILFFYSSNLLKSLDNSLIEDIDIVKSILRFNQHGKLNLYNQPNETSFAYAYKNRIQYLVRDAKHRPVRRSANMALIELPNPQFKNGQTQYLENISFADKNYRIYNYFYDVTQHAGNQSLIIHVIRSLDNYKNEKQALTFAMLQLAPLPIILVGFGGWWIAGRALRPINKLIDAVNHISADELTTRVSVTTQDEVGQLASAFNTFLTRLENAFSSLKRFTADASHELRTPLTSMRAQGEVALSRPREKHEYRNTIGSMLEDIERLEHLTDSLLQFARSDAGILKINLSRTNLSSLLFRWLDHLAPLSEEKSISINSDIDKAVEISIDEVIFERIIVNLVENAIHFTPANGNIDIRLLRQGNNVLFKVCDSGPGIPDEAKHCVFERFVRLDATRHAARGAGLGLAIVKWAVDVHDGTIVVTDNQPKGSCFTVKLPASKPAENELRVT